MDLPDLDVDALTAFHDGQLTQPGWLLPGTPDAERSGLAQQWLGSGPWVSPVIDNHYGNTRLWLAEDQARRPDVGADFIVRCKRDIDRLNQNRNDAVEAIDAALLSRLGGPAAGARQHSETAGAIIDRLSILALKIFHMRAQTRRQNAGHEHLAGCRAKLRILRIQRRDLAACLAALLRDVTAGRVYFTQYRQFKMYNDPALNPWLTGAPHG